MQHWLMDMDTPHIISKYVQPHIYVRDLRKHHQAVHYLPSTFRNSQTCHFAKLCLCLPSYCLQPLGSELQYLCASLQDD
jgi:hypothetical protein